MERKMNYKKALCGLICLNIVTLFLLGRLWRHILRMNQIDDWERRSPELREKGFSRDRKSVITVNEGNALPRCPHCGWPVSILMGFRFCPGCGNRLWKNSFFGEIPKRDGEGAQDLERRMM